MKFRQRMRLWHDRKGGVTILLAGALFMIAGAASVAVDLGSVSDMSRDTCEGISVNLSVRAPRSAHGSILLNRRGDIVQ